MLTIKPKTFLVIFSIATALIWTGGMKEMLPEVRYDPIPKWRDASIHKGFVRALADSDGDGSGNLPNLTARRDDFTEPGVDALLLVPFPPAPDFVSVHDVSDDLGSEPASGTITDRQALASATQARGLRIILDQVYSHSWHLRPWFFESASSHTNPMPDWYVRADAAADGGPPDSATGRLKVVQADRKFPIYRRCLGETSLPSAFTFAQVPRNSFAVGNMLEGAVLHGLITSTGAAILREAP